MFKEPLIKNVVALLGFTIVAQCIYSIGLPIISRIYSVEAFGNLAVLQAVSSLIIVVSALRYEVAILLPKDDNTAFNLLALSLILVCISTFIVTLALFFISNISFPRSKFSFLLDLWWLIPLFQLGAGTYATIINWSIRKQAFKTIGYTKITQTFSMIFLQVFLGIMRFDPIGLYIGDIFGRASASGAIFREIYLKEGKRIKSISIKNMIGAAHKYKFFPIYSTAAIIFSILGRNFVPVALAGTYGAASAGLFAMASRVIAFPIELLCRSFTQVYLGEAAKLSSEDPKELKKLFNRSAKRLFFIAIAPSLILFLFGPTLFGLVLGSQWSNAGNYARCMSVMVLFQFLNFPLVHTLNILEKQIWQLFWDGCNFILGIGGIFLLNRLGYSDIHAILYYSILMAIMFLVHYLLSILAINTKIRSQVDSTKYE